MKKIIFCIFMLIFGLSTTTVYGTYDEETYNEIIKQLKEEASKVTYKYEKVTNTYDDDGNYIKSGYKITAENLTENIFACAEKEGETYAMCMYYSDDNSENYIYYTDQDVNRLVVYGYEHGGEYATEKLKTSKYNPYSEREECKDVDISKLKACDPYYEYEVTDNIFNYQLQEYLNNQNKDNNNNKDHAKDPTKKDNNTDTTSNIVDYVKNYGLYIISIIAVFVIVVIVVKKRKDKRGVL